MIKTTFFSYSVSYGLVDIALAKLRHSRSVWGSLLHTYPQSLLYLTYAGGQSPNEPFLEKMIPAVETLIGMDFRWVLILL